MWLRVGAMWLRVGAMWLRVGASGFRVGAMWLRVGAGRFRVGGMWLRVGAITFRVCAYLANTFPVCQVWIRGCLEITNQSRDRWIQPMCQPPDWFVIVGGYIPL